MIDFLIQYGAWGLFVAAFLAATVLPFASEFVLVGVIAVGVDPWTALLAASAGNTLGGMTSYALGYIFELKKVMGWFGVRPDRMDRMYPYAHKYGFWMGFLGFMPAIGDVINDCAGFAPVFVDRSVADFRGRKNAQVLHHRVYPDEHTGIIPHPVLLRLTDLIFPNHKKHTAYKK